MGIDFDYSLSNGNKYPVIAAPWTMNFWYSMTAKMEDGWTILCALIEVIIKDFLEIF